MTRRIVSNPEQLVSGVTNLPIETTDLEAYQIARVSGGYLWDIVCDYVSEEFGIDLWEPDVHPGSI